MMEISNSGAWVNQGLIGMQRSQAEMTASARQIAEAPAAADLATPLVNLAVQSTIFDSSAKVVKTADQAIGSLLDIRA
jgi:flagellar hook protein FlgE